MKVCIPTSWYVVKGKLAKVGARGREAELPKVVAPKVVAPGKGAGGGEKMAEEAGQHGAVDRQERASGWKREGGARWAARRAEGGRGGWRVEWVVGDRQGLAGVEAM